MHILMCNDDGILADGLRHLASYLSQYYRITVVAPANEQSAKSNFIDDRGSIEIRCLQWRG